MKLKYLVLFVCLSVLGLACKKGVLISTQTETMRTQKTINEKFFLQTGIANPVTLLVLNEIKRRNDSKEFVSEFSQSCGLPVWGKALIVSSPKQDTVIYIPFVLEKTRFINGFIKAVINKGITISSFKSSEYNDLPFSGSSIFTAQSYVALLMYFENKVFSNDRFIITDPRLFADRIKSDKREIKIKSTSVQKPSRQALNSDCQPELLTVWIEWLVQDPPNCTCYDPSNCDWATGCTDCSNSFTSSFTYVYSSCSGGGSGSSSGGVWSPNPPPGGGGSTTIASSPGGYMMYPNTPEYFNFIDNTLSGSERFFWDDLNKADFVAILIKKLVQGNYSTATASSIQMWLNYLMVSDITSTEFENYFGNFNEGADGSYNTNYWDDPNLIFQSQPLPSLQAFSSAFPKTVNLDNTISYMPSSDVYTLVGGNLDIQNKLPNPNYQNACALRGSRALNYCGHPIDNTATATDLGSDGKKYIVSAKAFNKYMNKKYGPPTYRLTSTQINSDPDNIKNFLRGKSGIYSMVTSGGSFSGHADLILNGICLSGSATGNIANVDYIEIWELH